MRPLTVIAVLLALAGLAPAAGDLPPGRCYVRNRTDVPLVLRVAEADLDGAGAVVVLAELALEPGRGGFFETPEAGRRLLDRRLRGWYVFGEGPAGDLGFERDRDLRPDGSERPGRHRSQAPVWRVVVREHDL